MASATAAAAAIIIQKEMEAGLSSPEELACSLRAEVVGNVMARVADIGDTTNVPIVSLNSGDFSLVQPKAKFLKIALPRTGVIHIYEAQVFDYTGTNRALLSTGAVASQSSTLTSWGSTPCSASIAIDGNTVEDGSRACDGMSHTSTELYA
jgi:hypothetical protein